MIHKFRKASANSLIAAESNRVTQIVLQLARRLSAPRQPKTRSGTTALEQESIRFGPILPIMGNKIQPLVFSCFKANLAPARSAEKDLLC